MCLCVSRCCKAHDKCWEAARKTLGCNGIDDLPYIISYDFNCSNKQVTCSGELPEQPPPLSAPPPLIPLCMCVCRRQQHVCSCSVRVRPPGGLLLRQQPIPLQVQGPGQGEPLLSHQDSAPTRCVCVCVKCDRTAQCGTEKIEIKDPFCCGGVCSLEKQLL